MDAEKRYYLNKFRGTVFVLKFGGEVLGDADRLRNILMDVKMLFTAGVRIVIVYGGGGQADALIQKLGGKVCKVEGRRITDDSALEAIKMLFGGVLSLQLLGAMRAVRLNGVRISALDGNFMVARKRVAEIDYGHVGDIVSINPAVLHQSLDNGYVPVIPSLSADLDGNILNTNADTIATEVAGVLRAEKLVFFTNTDGVLVDGQVVSTLTTDEAVRYMEEGKIIGGMSVKMQNAMRAISMGVKRTQIINGTAPHSLLQEVLTDKGVGTMILEPPEKQKYHTEIKDRFDRLETKELLRQLVGIPSPSGDEAMIGKFLAGYLAGNGIDPTVSGRNVWAEKGDGDRVFLLQAHIDTVPPVRRWEQNPFEVVERDGRFYGLGSADNKAAAAAFTNAFLDLDIPKGAKVVLALTCEEEQGDQGLQKLISELPAPEAAVVGEPTGEEIRIAQRGRVVFEGQVRTAGGHTAYTPTTENAVFAALAGIEKIRALQFPSHPLVGDVIFQVSFFEAGRPGAYNVTPAEAVFQLECRTVPGVANAELIEKVTAAVDFPMRIIIDEAEAKTVDPSAPIVTAAKAAVGTETLTSAKGMTDLHCLSCPGIIFGPLGGNMHNAGEWVDLASLARVEEAIARLVGGYFES